MYGKRTKTVKLNCTFHAVLAALPFVHDMYMAKKVTPRFKKPQFNPTFIKQWREHRELSQEELAERVATYFQERDSSKGYTHASIQRLENGLIGYTQQVLEAIADALNTDPASLLMRNPEDSEGLWSVWDKAKPADRQKIIEIAKTLVGTGTSGR